MSEPMMVAAIARYVTEMPVAHAALLVLVNGQIADGDDSDAALRMRDLLESVEVADARLALMLSMEASS